MFAEWEGFEAAGSSTRLIKILNEERVNIIINTISIKGQDIPLDKRFSQLFNGESCQSLFVGQINFWCFIFNYLKKRRKKSYMSFDDNNIKMAMKAKNKKNKKIR